MMIGWLRMTLVFVLHHSSSDALRRRALHARGGVKRAARFVISMVSSIHFHVAMDTSEGAAAGRGAAVIAIAPTTRLRPFIMQSIRWQQGVWRGVHRSTRGQQVRERVRHDALALGRGSADCSCTNIRNFLIFARNLL